MLVDGQARSQVGTEPQKAIIERFVKTTIFACKRAIFFLNDIISIQIVAGYRLDVFAFFSF